MDKNLTRHPLLLEKGNVALVVIDMQEKFKPVIPEFDKLVKNVKTLVQCFQMWKLPVLVTEQYPQGLGETVKELKDCFHIIEISEKTTFSCVQNDHFNVSLNRLNVNRLVVCGIESHVCVHQTVHDLLHRHYNVWVVRDAIGSRDPQNAEVGFQRMVGAGALPTSTEMLLFEMAFEAGSEGFKELQKLVK